MRKLCRVTLSQAERKQLFEMLRQRKSSALRQAHARVLLQAAESEDSLSRSDGPEGHAQWSVRLLADRMVVLEYVESVSRETVQRAKQKMRSSRSSKKCG